MTELIAMPKISVAMCTYNGERHLGEQLETIAAQTRQPLELVVADDGSTDDTLALLEAFSQRSPFPVHIHRNGRQLGSTANFDAAIRLCHGEYIALCDQDDRWRPEKLAGLGELLDTNPDVGVVFSDATLIDVASAPTGKTLWEAFRFTPQVRARFLTDPGAVLLERPVATGATMLFRRSLLQHFSSIPPEWVHDGWITWMGVLWTRVLFTEIPLTAYRVHATQQLGVGGTSLRGRVTRIRGQQRAIYRQLAKELQVLRLYVEQSATALDDRTGNLWRNRITYGIAFFQERAAAPASFRGRLLFLARHWRSYRALPGQNWRVMLRDLLMAPEAKHERTSDRV